MQFWNSHPRTVSSRFSSQLSFSSHFKHISVALSRMSTTVSEIKVNTCSCYGCTEPAMCSLIVYGGSSFTQYLCRDHGRPITVAALRVNSRDKDSAKKLALAIVDIQL